MFINLSHYSLIEQLKAVKLVQNYLVLEKLQKAHSSIIKTYALYYVRKKISALYSFLKKQMGSKKKDVKLYCLVKHEYRNKIR